MIIEDNKIKSANNQDVAHIDNNTNRLIIDRGEIGTIVDSKYAQLTAFTSANAVIPLDDSIPQITEGTEVLSVTITPKSATNKIRFRVSGQGSTSAASEITVAVFNTLSTDALATQQITCGTAGWPLSLNIVGEHMPGATTALTYSVRVGASGSTVYLNGVPNTRRFGGSQKWTLVLEEIQA